MKLRRRIVLTAAGLLLSLGLVATIGVIWLMKTQSGFDFVKGRLESALRGKVNGKVYVGRIGGPSLNAPTIDSIEVRDMDDSVIFASGPISLKLDLLDFWEKRLAFTDVVIQRPYFHLRRLETGHWNYRPMIRRDSGGIIPSVPRAGMKLGDYVVLQNVKLHGGKFKWTDSWSPSKWFRGAARDSVIRYNLARTDVDVQRIAGKYYKVRHWDSLEITAPRVTIKDPANPGFSVDFSDLDVIENDPPFNLRNASGLVTHLRDTVNVDIRKFQLPGSSGSAKGILITKPGLGVRVRVVGDTVSMKDIAWLYPTMPTEGTGRMVLDIRKDSTRDFIDYVLTNIDVQSTQSRLRGAMTFGVGNEILALTDVDLDLAPVNFKLIEQFAGGPLTLPWAGDLSGHVKARGGPLNQFYVDSTSIAFTDANVPGVVNRFSGRGMLDIVRPIETKFFDFSANIHHFDLRTARALDSLFPPLVGWIYGTAQLDSIWTDVRLRDANVYYAADSASVSRFTGGGRVIVGETEMSYDLAMTADSVNMGSFALSYPNFPFKGTYAGSFTVKGAISALELAGELKGEGGVVKTSGLVYDGLEPSFGATGTIDLTTINLARVLIKPPTWNGTLTATIDAAIKGDSLENLEGRARIRLARSTIADLTMREGYTSMTFGDGLMRIDSLNAISDAFSLQGRGALGIRSDRRDTLHLTTELDSLGGMRKFIAPTMDSLPVDSLKGRVTASVRLFGNLDSLGLRATANGTDVVYGTTIAEKVDAGFDIDDLTGRRVGTASITARTMQALGIRFTEMQADARLGGDTARVIAKATSETGPVIDAGTTVSWDSLATNAIVDSLQITIDDHRWRLARPARIHSTADGTVIDSLELRMGDTTTMRIAASVPRTGQIAGAFTAEAFPLSDLGRLFQVTVPVSGRSDVGATLSGTRDAPIMGFELRARNAGLGETRVEGLRLFGEYANRELKANLEYTSGGAVVMRGDAMLPMNLALRRVPRRILNTPLSAHLKADTTDLAILKTFYAGITDASGKLTVDITADGTWEKPNLGGSLRIANGMVLMSDIGIPYRDIDARLRFIGDSVQIDRLWTRTSLEDSMKVLGYMSFAERDNPGFTLVLQAYNFHAIRNPTIADLTITTSGQTGIRLHGSQNSSTLSGGLRVDGLIFIPDTYTKTLITINENYIRANAEAFENRRLLPPAPPKIVANMGVQQFEITAGNNLTLKSAEANVRLSGRLEVAVKPSPEGGQLDLLGTLQATGGTYRLNAGPIQRMFNVQAGTIRFFGDPEQDAEMNVTATHTIRQYDQRAARQDIEVTATLSGPLYAPQVSLSSDNARVSGQDLISYITFGGPSLAVGGRLSDYANTVTSGLITSGASALSAGALGGACNLSTANVAGGYNTGLGQATRSIIAGTRFGCGKQFNERTFARLDAGICQLNQQIDDLANSVGAKIEYRFTNSIVGSAGIDPPTSALVCAQTTNTRGFVPTPRQLGIDIFRTWRW